MLDLAALDLGEIATALEDQRGYEHRWLINRKTGETHAASSSAVVPGRVWRISMAADLVRWG